jgi:hypothetical protein
VESAHEIIIEKSIKEKQSEASPEVSRKHKSKFLTDEWIKAAPRSIKNSTTSREKG